MNKLLLSVLVGLCAPILAQAATVSFEPQESTVGLAGPFVVAVNLSSEVPVNALALSITFSDNLEPVDISDGNSILNFWIKKPVFDEQSRTLDLEAIIPGGFSGKGGRLVTVTVRAKYQGSGDITLDTGSSHAYRNAIPVSEEPLASSTLTLLIQSAKHNLDNTLPDTHPPEVFTPSLVKLPTDSGEKWMLVFATQDKDSGIDHYEVKEEALLPWQNFAWHTVQSPYELKDQELQGRAVVRAYDKAGNVREETLTLSTSENFYNYTLYLLFAILIITSTIFAVLRVKSA